MGSSIRRRHLALAGLALLLAGLLCAPAAPARVRTSEVNRGGCGAAASTPLDGICDYLAGREGVVQVALYDKTADRSYRVSTGDDKQYTASIVKVDILARWLRKYQKRGAKIPNDIPYSIRYLMQNMIQHSDNVAATSLFYFGGGCDALNRFNTLIPMDDTDVACESESYYGWGNTRTTASDQVELMKAFAFGRGDGILNRDAESYGLQLMQNIQADQRFGVSCGPWGTSCDPPSYAPPDPDVIVALKNGWKTLPTCRDPIPQCPWQVNSTGWIKGQGRNYALAVLTTDDPVGSGDLYGYNYGIETIQGVSKLVWANLG